MVEAQSWNAVSEGQEFILTEEMDCLLYTSPSPRD